MTDVYAVPKAFVGAKVNLRELMEISIGNVKVLLDHAAAVQIESAVRVQLETAEIVRLTAYCVNSNSQILNFPLSRTEARDLLTSLEPFIYGE